VTVSTTSTLEVYADIWCPFAHVGLKAAVAMRAGLGHGDVALEIHSWPLELVNGEPMDPMRVAANVHALREQVAPDLFAGFDEGAFPVTTLPALALAESAYRTDPLVGEAVSLALRDALFENGQDVSRAEVLDEIAQSHGLGRGSSLNEDVVREWWRRGQERGVQGSPHFFCRGRDSFCPSLDIERGEQGQLLLRRNIERLRAFLGGCFEQRVS
jgi:predicted DsbA family dithiol-disulfide isomerase